MKMIESCKRIDATAGECKAETLRAHLRTPTLQPLPPTPLCTSTPNHNVSKLLTLPPSRPLAGGGIFPSQSPLVGANEQAIAAAFQAQLLQSLMSQTNDVNALAALSTALNGQTATVAAGEHGTGSQHACDLCRTMVTGTVRAIGGRKHRV